MKIISCEHAFSLYGYIIDGESLSEEEQQQLEAHLGECEQCRVQLDGLHHTDRTISTTLDTALQKHISTAELGAFVDEQIESEIKRKKIQKHLQTCEACQEVYQQLKLMNELQPTFELNTRSISHRLAISDWLKQIGEKIGSLFPAARILVPVAVSLLLLIVVYNIYEKSTAPATLSELAETAPYPYIDLGLRQSYTSIEQLQYQAMQDYEQKNYHLAQEKLSEVVARDSMNNTAQFYLGMCYFMENQLDKAEEQLRIVTQTEPTQEKGYWYLAQVYLKKGDRANVLKALEKVVELQQENFSEKAEELIEKVKRIK